MSRPCRMFLAVTYTQEQDLIEVLPAVESHLGKYDFFSQYLKRSSSWGETGYQKIFSIKKLYSREKFENFYKKIEKIQKSGANVSLLGGYLNSEQVVSLHNTGSPEKIQIGRELYARLELTYEGQKYGNTSWTASGLSSSDAHRYFDDLRRIYLSEV